MSHSPILFESDDENADYNNDETIDLTISEPPIKRPPGYDKDRACVLNLRSILKGVPPPPNYTTPELDTNDLLSKYYEHSKILSFGSEITPMDVSVDIPPTETKKTDSATVEGVGELSHKDTDSIVSQPPHEDNISNSIEGVREPSHENVNFITSEGVRELPYGDANAITTEGVKEPSHRDTNLNTSMDFREPTHEGANSITNEAVMKIIVGESADCVNDQDNKVNNFVCYRDDWRKDVSFREDYSSIKWPDISHINYFDIYYNLGDMSEELSSLIDKYRERYIGCETGSSFVMRKPVMTGSAKKRAKRRAWGGYSPGRRLSHLAQRRRTFSSANLSLYSTNINGRAILPGGSNSNKSAVSKKVIMVDMKSKNAQKSKSTSRIKEMSRTLSKPSVNNSKRALFQSPDQITKNSGRKDRTKTTPNKSRNSKRVLWPSSDKKNRRSAKKATPKKTVIEDSDEEIGSEEVINANGKRLSNSSESCQARKRCQKSLNFISEHKTPVSEGNTSAQSTDSAPKQQQPQRNQQLSQLHKQKMLWAVASSLKQNGINNSHELFRPAGTVLFKKCRQVWLHMLSTKKSDVKRSTSEQMFEMAIKYAPETIKKLKSGVNSRVSLSTENFVNINSVTSEEKSKAGFSKVSDIFFNNVKNSQSSQEDPSTRTEGENESNLSIKPLAEIVDSNSNSLSHQSSEVGFVQIKREKTCEISNSEFSNSNTDDSIEKNLVHMFDGCISKSIKLDGQSNSPMDLPKLFSEDSQVSQFNIISNNTVCGTPNLSIDKLSSNSVFNQPIKNEEPIDSSLRDIVENLKSQIESSLNENDSGFIDNESTGNKVSKSGDLKLTKNEIQSPTTFTATVSKEFSSRSEEKENTPLKLRDIPTIPISSAEKSESGTFRFKKFGSLAENIEPSVEKESDDSNKSSVVSSANFDETAMSSCDISVKES